MKQIVELRNIEDFAEYLEKLKFVSRNYVVCMVVKDTPGNCMPDNIIRLIRDLGFLAFSKELWRMYIGFVYRDSLIDYVADKREESICKKIRLQNQTLELTSMPWRNGNLGSIKIDGIEASINKRGLNIVVYDSDNCEVVDSVRFDSHETQFVFERKRDIALVSEKIKWVKDIHHYDVCVAGVWYGANYGSILNGYSIYKIFKSLGKNVLMLHKPKSPENDAELRSSNHNVVFYKKYYDDSSISPIFNYDELELLNDYCDCFCSGSDQIWNYNVSFDGNMYLPFVNKNKWRISFASSFGSGNDHVPNEKRNDVEKCLHDFDAISVREEFDKRILREKYNVDSTVVIDPVFCIDKNEYYNLMQESNFLDDNYVLAYILDPSDKKLDFLRQIATELGKHIVTICDGAFNVINSSWSKYARTNDYPNLNIRMEVGDFLRAFSMADFIVTDSFHGTAFSIIFEKKFISICNPIRGKERFYDLLGRFDLLDRLVEDNQLIWTKKFNKSINYEEVNTLIQSEKNNTIDWLSEALSISKKKVWDNKEEKHVCNNPDFIKIKILATLFRDYGIKNIVLSPGGRDVPLVRIFEYNDSEFDIHMVTDERSAAYYGLGIATQLRSPVACICTSGTAASNFLPAVTEAYYTGIPLIVVTADRQEVYHGIGEDQTIPQWDIYAGVVKKSITIPEGNGYKVEYQTRRDISDCILETIHNGFGPTHINIAIDNIAVGARLSRDAWKLLPAIKPHILRVGFYDKENRMMDWVNELKKSQRILVVYGQNFPLNNEQRRFIELFAQRYNCVIVTDHISNLKCSYSVKSYNILRSVSNKEFNEQLSPDILISVGGKRLMNDPLTFKIRDGSKNIRHWSVVPDGQIKDFYFRLTSVIEMTQDKFFEWFSIHANESVNNGNYYQKWIDFEKRLTISEEIEFNSNYIQKSFLPKIPNNSILHLGVGLTFMESRKYHIPQSVEVYCNMGTNGIDGCTSTFLGQCAVVRDKLCFLMVGDLSFFYDMNSIWNKPLNNNVRIVMVNNNGSGLLRNNNLKAITSVHNTSAKGWVESVGFKYMTANNMDEFEDKLKIFISKESEAPLFFEVFCK